MQGNYILISQVSPTFRVGWNLTWEWLVLSPSPVCRCRPMLQAYAIEVIVRLKVSYDSKF